MNNLTKIILIVVILFGYYLVTNEFPPFYLLIIAVIFLGLGNTHLWGEKNSNKKSFIQKWYGVSDEEEKVDPLLDRSFVEKYVLEKIANTTDKRFAEILFGYTKKNFQRLSERFKFEDKMIEQISKDWCDYCMALGGMIYLGDYPDFAMDNEQRKKNYEEQDGMLVRVFEIEKRFKELLGNDYLDPRKELVHQEGFTLGDKQTRWEFDSTAGEYKQVAGGGTTDNTGGSYQEGANPTNDIIKNDK